jgi:hypothetical protein
VQGRILDAIARTLWSEVQRATNEIELVGFSQGAFIQFHDDQVAIRRDLADRVPWFNLFPLCVCPA